MSNLDTLLSKADKYLKFESKNKHTWCSGCGNYGIISAMKRALTLQDLTPRDVMMCYDVGCNGNESDKFYANTIHGLHGRVLPLATGCSLANPKLTVIAQAGDGSTLSEGINHLIHAIRCNYNFTFVLHNNSIYGLTIGQASSTTREHQKASGTVGETATPPLNILDLVLSLNPTFVARGFSSNVDHLTDLIQAGINHNGFSFIEVMQACPTFNKATPQEWYWDKLNDVSKLENYNKTDIWQARKIVQDMNEKLAVGIIYQKDRPTFEQLQSNRQYTTTTLVEEVKNYDITELMTGFQI
jgi:2-oxoglutarate/2-oxoacid ferredoxin oxidoreductase subunit beta